LAPVINQNRASDKRSGSSQEEGVMSRKLAIALTAAAISFGVAVIPAGVAAAHGGGGGGHGGGGGGHGGGGGSHGVPGGASVNRGVGTQTFVNRGMTSAPLAGRRVTGNGRYAWIGGHRVHGRHIHGFIPGIGYGWYWYYDDCYVLTDYGWINMCGYNY
jgi:hypothetical protein